ncbi:MAG: hypothetical protein V7641_5474 [Blastocatellia bacterium]
MPAPDMHSQESPNPSFWLLILSGSTLIVALGIIGYVYSYHSKEEDGAFLLTLLFSIPLILQIICLWILYRKLHSDKKVRKFFWTLMILIFPSALVIIALWWIYTFYPSDPSWIIHYLPLMLLGLFGVCIAVMTNSLMEPSSSDELTALERSGNAALFPRRLRPITILKGLKDGVSQVPFVAVLFFFFFFLTMGYLLGFAFAFHGKREFPLPKEERAPALYLSKKYSANPDDQKQLRKDANMSGYRSEYQAASDQHDAYTFYFDSDSAYMINNDSPSNDEIGIWKRERNEEQLNRLADYIIANTRGSEKIRIQLKGQTDGNIPNTNKYPNNHALSEARALNMQFTILKKLSEKDGQTPKWRNIEWYYAALSNEFPLEATPNEDFHRRIEPLRNKVSPTHQEEMKKVANRLGVVESLDKGKEKLSPHDGDWLIGILEGASDIAINATLPAEAKADQFKRALDDFDEAVKYIKLLDRDARKRIVVASIMPFQPAPTPVEPEYTRLKLLDYMYLAIYTVTTTGYGDIVPTSNYAKFLCTLGNFLAVFFLVVFFNILLSIRKGEQIINPTRERFDATGGTGKIIVHLKHGLHWKVECHDNEMLTINSDKSGHGSGIVSYSVLHNHRPDSRIGRITIAGETCWVEQAGSSCFFTIEDLDKASESEFEAKGKSHNQLKITTGPDCSWHLFISDSDMIVIEKSSSTPKGSGSLIYSVTRNQGKPREGTIFIGGEKHTVKQKGRIPVTSTKDKQG